jgi:hypothetical protein
MRSYIKIRGPPIFKAVRELEKIVVRFPLVCFMDPLVYSHDFKRPEDIADYFYQMDLENPVSPVRCVNIISKHKEMLGEYDFFEWFEKPPQPSINDLIEKIDHALTPLECRYAIITKQ